MILEGETILEDDYPVYYGYFYVADGKVVESYIQGTVADLKRRLGSIEIRRCELVKREVMARERMGITHL